MNAAVALLILATGFKNYVRLQTVMIVATLIAFATMLVVLLSSSPAASALKLDEFALAISGVPDFVKTAVDATVAAGIDLDPPFSLLATILVAPDRKSVV